VGDCCCYSSSCLFLLNNLPPFSPLSEIACGITELLFFRNFRSYIALAQSQRVERMAGDCLIKINNYYYNNNNLPRFSPLSEILPWLRLFLGTCTKSYRKEIWRANVLGDMSSLNVSSVSLFSSICLAS
jgi:hypothetical protein